MNIIYEQSIGLHGEGPSLEERIDDQLYEPTTDGVASAEFDLKWINELVSKKRVELNDAQRRFETTSNPQSELLAELCEWELGELVQRQVALRRLLPQLRKLYHAALKREFQPLGADDEERPTSIDDIFGERDE